MAAKISPVKASGLKHIMSGHYGATVNGKQVLVKLPHNVSAPEEGSDMNVFPDWLVEDMPGLSEVQKDFLAAKSAKPIGGENANTPAE
jgi:hypothetical protein